MSRIFGRNSSGTWGPQCPEGHGTLLTREDWGTRLWCPACGKGNGAFYDPDDPRIIEGRSPDADAKMAAYRREQEEVMRTAMERTHTHRAEIQAAKARPRALSPAPAEGPLCLCGCGEHTRGGRFRPGHDARWHAAQKKASHAVAG